MYYKSCQWVNNGAGFEKNAIQLCCFGYLQGKGHEEQTVLLRNYHGELIDWQKLLDIKEKHRQMHRKGEYLDTCKDCIYLEERDWREERYINHFILTTGRNATAIVFTVIPQKIKNYLTPTGTIILTESSKTCLIKA